MSLTWEEFHGGVHDKRLLVPIDEFVFDVSFVYTRPDPTAITYAANLFTSAVIAPLQERADCELSALQFAFGKLEPEQEQRADIEPAYFSVIYRSPVYDFMIQVGPTIFRISKRRTSIEDLIRTVPIWEEIMRRLFADVSDPSMPADADDGSPSFVDALGLRDRTHKVNFRFAHKLSLAGRITRPNEQPTNLDVIKRLIRTTLPAGVQQPEHEAPLGALQPEGIRRGDISIGFRKTINSRIRTLWVTVESPYNVTQKDVDLAVTYRCGDVGTSLEWSDLVDWTTPFRSFYRDLIINRLMEDLFFDLSIAPRLD